VGKFKNKASFGHDLIPNDIIKKSIKCIALPLAEIINCSFRNGMFPDELKIAKVCPVFKNGAQNIFSNYRPISLLPNFSKIFEKVMYCRLESYVVSKNILSSSQYGFRHNHSTYMALLDMYNKISSATDDKDYAIGIFIDLSKAFDTLNHKILISKLQYYGIRGVPLLWFQSYLSNRQQYVFYNNVSSSVKNVTCGVPQGSILGPLLFLLYINDIVNSSKILHFIIFADDTNLFFSSKDLIKLTAVVNTELNKLSIWFSANKLSLNVKKTNFMLFGSKAKIRLFRNTSIQILLNGILLERVAVTKFLGVYVDENLSWNKHTSQIALKISKSLGVINRVKHILSYSCLSSLYYTMIQPYFTYCNIIWGGANKNILKKLTGLQKRSMRLITRSQYLTSCNPLFAKTGILKLTDMYNMHILLFVYKIKNNLLPVSCSQHLIPYVKKHRYEFRQVPIFQILKFKSEIRHKYVGIAGPRLWNSLPMSIKESESLVIFKTRIFQFFLSCYS